MKLLKILAMCVMVLLPCFAKAECLTQQTTVVFINGIWTTKADAEKHSIDLETEARKAGVSSDCVHFAYSHTQDDAKSADIIEAIIQKSQETGATSSILNYIKMLLRMNIADHPFLSLVSEIYFRNIGGTVDSQTAKHLQNFRNLALNKGHRGIMATHSQGGLYGNVLWNQLTQIEKENTRMVAVATPSNNVAGANGPNTRLVRDGVANLFFTDALAADIPNTGLCKNETTDENQNSWECHGFDTGYLNDLGAREQIISDIKDALPKEPANTLYGIIQGYVHITVNGNPVIPPGQFDVLVFSIDSNGNQAFAGGTPSNRETGFYQITILPGNYVFYGRTEVITVQAGMTTIKDYFVVR